jgi:hypothetical protein
MSEADLLRIESFCQTAYVYGPAKTSGTLLMLSAQQAWGEKTVLYRKYTVKTTR